MTAVWTPLEKRKLLYALYQYGPTDIDALHRELPNKTKQEIKVLCEEHAKLALSRREERTQPPCVKKWLQVFQRLKEPQTGHIHDVVPRVLKYIGLFEQRVPTKSLDLSECYLTLSNMCRGLDPEKLSDNTEYILNECLVKLAKCVKYGNCRECRRHVSSLQEIKDVHSHRSNPNSKIESSTVLNPLGIPESYFELNKIELSRHNEKLL